MVSMTNEREAGQITDKIPTMVTDYRWENWMKNFTGRLFTVWLAEENSERPTDRQTELAEAHTVGRPHNFFVIMRNLELA
jgi:hypothetical protein